MTEKFRWMTGWITMSALLACGGCAAAVAQETVVSPQSESVKGVGGAEEKRLEAEYRIGPEDVLQIAVWKSDVLSKTVPVRPDGKISLPLLNDVEVAGLTPMELNQVLVKRLSEYMPNPEVSVIVLEAKSFKVSVIGEVPRPGRYELKSATSVLDLLAIVGGLNQFASRSKIFVLRMNGKTATKLPFSYNKALSSGGERENFYLQPGDILVVP